MWGATHPYSLSGSGSTDFNPRSPCGERPVCAAQISLSYRFQSTLPVWGATDELRHADMLHTISIHAPRVGSDDPLSNVMLLNISISIHAPRVGSDLSYHCHIQLDKRFQSTLPVWGATIIAHARQLVLHHFNPRSPCGERPMPWAPLLFPLLISIHAPRVGSDPAHHEHDNEMGYFNPRSPCGERPLLPLVRCKYP